MAEALKKLEEQLNCSICLDTYTDPKLLQCFHVYCRQCLVPLVDQGGHLGIACPTCRQVTPVPDRGVAGLQPAFHINHFLEILENSATTPTEAVESATTVDAPSTGDHTRHCFEHPEEELKLYCETCGELVCFQCAIKGGKHHDHNYALLKKAFEKYKDEITSSLEPMEKKVSSAKKALARLESCSGEISDQRAATAESVHSTFRRLREVLDVRETEVIGQLDQIAQRKLKSLAIQKDEIETTLAQLCSCLHFTRESLRTGKEEDVLMMKPNTVRQVRDLTTPFQPDFLEPSTKADIAFSASPNIATECQGYGQVLSHGLPDPSKCHITTDAYLGGEVCNVVLHALNSMGKPCMEPIQSLEAELVSELTGTRASCSVERRGPSKYKISYQPTIKGRHQLHIKVEGQHIRGSPFGIGNANQGYNFFLSARPNLNLGSQTAAPPAFLAFSSKTANTASASELSRRVIKKATRRKK